MNEYDERNPNLSSIESIRVNKKIREPNKLENTLMSTIVSASSGIYVASSAICNIPAGSQLEYGLAILASAGVFSLGLLGYKAEN